MKPFLLRASVLLWLRTPLLVLISAVGISMESSAQTPPPMKATAANGAAEFFESQIRPIWANNCFSCHGPEKQKAKLRLDSQDALTKGSENGPVIVPGKPEASKLIQAINYGGDPQMPPKGKLPPKAIDALTAWVKMGLPWPDSAVKASADSETEAWKTHWAFQPDRKPPLPSVRNSSRISSPLDAFILAKLEDKVLSPAPPADRRTLIR